MAKELITFSPQAAKAIIDFIKNELRKLPKATNEVSGKSPTNKRIVAKIGANETIDGVVYHSFEQVRWDKDSGDFVLTPEGKTGTAINAITAQEIPANEIVELVRFDALDGSSTWLCLGYSTKLFIQITDNEQDSINMRWKYGWYEVTKTSSGYGGWEELEYGRSGTTTENPIYNTVENMNGEDGLFGNGVDSANLTGTMTIQPIPAGVILEATAIQVENSLEFWVSYENGVDGGCEEEA